MVTYRKRTMAEISDRHGSLMVERNPAVREWVIRHTDQDVQTHWAVSDEGYCSWPDKISDRHVLLKTLPVPVAAVFFERVEVDEEPPFPGGPTWHGIDLKHLVSVDLKSSFATASLVPSSTRRYFVNGNDVTLILGGDYEGLSERERFARLGRVIERDKASRRESGPSAVASAPPVRRGPVVFCQSQYDPDD